MMSTIEIENNDDTPLKTWTWASGRVRKQLGESLKTPFDKHDKHVE